MASTQKHRLTAFSPCQASFVTVSDDNRVKLWDAASGALRSELKERDHLSYKYTCLAWSKSSPWAAAGKKAKRSAAGDLGIIALGTTTGAIIVWNLEKGEVAARLARDNNDHGHGSAVTDIVFSSTGTSLFSSAAEKNVFEWNVKDAKMLRKIKVGSDGATKLALSANDDVLAVGASSIKLFDVVSGKKSKRLTFGHASAVTQLFFSACGRYLFSSSAERFVNVFDATSDSEDPLYNFSCDSTPVHVHGRVTVAKKAKNSTAIVVATTEAGAVFVWTHTMTAASKPIAAVAKVLSSAVLVASLTSATEASVIVARGAAIKPHFETVALVDADGAFRGDITLEALDNTGLLLEKPSKKAKTADETEAKTHVPSLLERGSAKTSTATDATVAQDEDEDEDEATLGERVQALADELEHSENEDEDADTVLTYQYRSTSRVKAQASSASLVSVLEQALQSKDNVLLENCLRVHDLKVIDETCRRLSPTKVFPFVLLLVEKLEKRPTRGATLCLWIKYLLLNHTAYLMTVPDVVDKLSGLYQALDARLTVFPQLHKLNGRLNLVLGQIAGRANAIAVDETPLVTYREDDEDAGDDDNDDEETADDDDDAEDDENDEDDEDSE
ncbi:hypothetical protein SDRG_00348 [Saprolegnia diclina VS20]|uniref:Small-subunit processome Utp12 domain-containing protein n=1 Tax=Saprolegnia diclina (strain VS20) TaxID=1156394 RepID=T0QWL4_SAPDV|nr:hypothetical protein SDRG_00348 [Saprolegnia diclina VS20]EQC42619.1 hypothetical protein SDRG_00348 [Saprolegnia diclina VS20]|eukprot:XP_008604042.1 hypothetical protein SDRG_00348 [Saprolegnia diclina VS20]